jgi:hypothetical protein
MNLSVVLATYNEEENLGRCLESVKVIAGEIIVVDGSSTDRTVAVAQNYGAKIVVVPNRPMFHTNKQLAIDQAGGNWVLQLDADEVVSPELAGEIGQLTGSAGRYAAYYLKRKNIFLGRWLTKGGQYPDPVIRLFKTGKARLPGKSVHEQMEVSGEVGELSCHLIHHTAPTLRRYLTNANRYTNLTASQLCQENPGLGIIPFIQYLIFKPAVTFLSLYLRHKGFVDGFPGFAFALFSGLHWPLAYFKYRQLIGKI